MMKLCIYSRVICVCLVLLASSGCEPEWKVQANLAFQRGITAQNKAEAGAAQGKFRKLFRKARDSYLETLQYNPYHVEANLRLGDLFVGRFNQLGKAIIYYRRYLDLNPQEPQTVARVKQQLKFLADIESGVTESPYAAVSDFVWSIKTPSRTVFWRRVSAEAFKKRSPAAIFKRWRGLIPKSAYCRKLSQAFYMNKDVQCASVRLLVRKKGRDSIYRLDMKLSAAALWEIVSYPTD